MSWANEKLNEKALPKNESRWKKQQQKFLSEWATIYQHFTSKPVWLFNVSFIIYNDE